MQIKVQVKLARMIRAYSREGRREASFSTSTWAPRRRMAACVSVRQRASSCPPPGFFRDLPWRRWFCIWKRTSPLFFAYVQPLEKSIYIFPQDSSHKNCNYFAEIPLKLSLGSSSPPPPPTGFVLQPFFVPC